jgi:hypothetical protein
MQHYEPLGPAIRCMGSFPAASKFQPLVPRCGHCNMARGGKYGYGANKSRELQHAQAPLATCTYKSSFTYPLLHPSPSHLSRLLSGCLLPKPASCHASPTTSPPVLNLASTLPVLQCRCPALPQAQHLAPLLHGCLVPPLSHPFTVQPALQLPQPSRGP